MSCGEGDLNPHEIAPASTSTQTNEYRWVSSGLKLLIFCFAWFRRVSLDRYTPLQSIGVPVSSRAFARSSVSVMFWPLMLIRTRGTPACLMLRMAVRRRSWKCSSATPAAPQASSHAQRGQAARIQTGFSTVPPTVRYRKFSTSIIPLVAWSTWVKRSLRPSGERSRPGAVVSAAFAGFSTMLTLRDAKLKNQTKGILSFGW